MPDLLRTSSYAYELPPERIAQFPADRRELSRLMRLNVSNKSIDHFVFTQLPSLLKDGDLLVLNNSKVFPARLFAQKENGTKIELFLLHPSEEPDTWHCLIYPSKRVKREQWIKVSNRCNAFVHSENIEGVRKVSFEIEGDFWQEIYTIGHVPLPPYINRSDNEEDKSRYQTVYAKINGSVAAPTAGLHFTDELLSELKAKGIELAELTLHVGIGTFKPVKKELITEHKMHSEFAEVPIQTAEAINKARAEKRRIVAVGTTSARTLESFWLGEKMTYGRKWTDIFIYPGYQFKVMDAIITNFHLPESTLLMMISAFAGYDFIMQAYRTALKEEYRFFSYGDAMLVEI